MCLLNLKLNFSVVAYTQVQNMPVQVHAKEIQCCILIYCIPQCVNCIVFTSFWLAGKSKMVKVTNSYINVQNSI